MSELTLALLTGKSRPVVPEISEDKRRLIELLIEDHKEALEDLKD